MAVAKLGCAGTSSRSGRHLEDVDPRLDAFILGLRAASARGCVISAPRAATNRTGRPLPEAMSAQDCRPARADVLRARGRGSRGVRRRHRRLLGRRRSTREPPARSGGCTGSTCCCARPGEAGAVLCGVSAGMNCWFESVHDRLVRADASRRCTTASGFCQAPLPALRRRGAAPPALPRADRRGRARARLGVRRRRRAALRTAATCAPCALARRRCGLPRRAGVRDALAAEQRQQPRLVEHGHAEALGLLELGARRRRRRRRSRSSSTPTRSRGRRRRTIALGAPARA